MEDTPIGTHERAKLIQVDGQSFLIISAKNQPPAIVPFDETHGNKPKVLPTSIPKQAKASGANTPSNAPFLEAMKQARRRNPNLGLDQS
jgi:hypothetical protein